MGYRDDLYNVFLLLHLVAVVVGFGTVALNGVYGAIANRRQGAEGAAISEANFEVSKLAEWAIYATPVLGIVLVLLSDSAIEFTDTWIVLAIVLYLVGIAVSHAVLFPTHKRLNVLARELASMGAPPPGAPPGPPPQVAEIEACGKKLGMAGTFLNLLVVVLIYLMVFKPGGGI